MFNIHFTLRVLSWDTLKVGSRSLHSAREGSNIPMSACVLIKALSWLCPLHKTACGLPKLEAGVMLCLFRLNQAIHFEYGPCVKLTHSI